MDIVQRFKSGIAWYQPTTDANSWKYFYNQCYSIDYTAATAETLKKVAWWSAKLQTTEDVGMWADRAARLQKFLAADIADNGEDPLFNTAIQYDFVACFLNKYGQASHNEDLWKSINDSAVKVLNEQILPPSGLAQYQPPRVTVPQIGGLWLLPAIPAILYNALKTVNLSYYRPTEDTNTWAYFQDIVFDIDVLGRCQFTYKHTYLLSNISSPVDSGMWSTLAAASSAFLDANLGGVPATAKSQVTLAINFCNLFKFNYQHAAHNADLFQAYHDAFDTAVTKLQLLQSQL